jgi:hypothetical protein
LVSEIRPYERNLYHIIIPVMGISLELPTWQDNVEKKQRMRKEMRSRA